MAAATATLVAAPESASAVTLRVQVDQKGDFAVVGNTLGFDCAAGTPAPIVGTVGNCGMFVTDDSPDVFWRSDEPVDGQALADASVTVAQARSTAILQLPVGASVTHALLYWGAKFPTVDPDATFERPGAFSQTVTAVASFLDAQFPIYQSVADVTALVQQHGAGAYRVGGVSSIDFVNLDDIVEFAGWSLVVFYQLDADPPRNLAVFDGLDRVADAAGQSIVLSRFLVPNAAFDGKLGVIAYEGDSTLTGDQLLWDGNLLENAVNPSTNFFNSTRSFLGAPAYAAGDLPQLTGTAQSTGGIDLDVVNITPFLSAGQTSAVIDATTTGEIYWLGALITSVSTYKPDLTSATKSVVDLDGGAVLAGDELDYTITVMNTGSDASVDTVLTDVLPSQVSLVPGSIEITSGANSGPKTEVPFDDQADFDAPEHTLVVRLGTGANATQGGSLAVGASTTVVFRVTIDAGATGTIENQATITASGAQGAPPENTPTDGNGAAMGSPPTVLVIDECETDAECQPPEPRCDTAPDPNACVECLTDADCMALEPVCNPPTKTCVCTPLGQEMCGNGTDEDCDGALDNGCGGGGAGGASVGGAAGSGGAGGVAGAGAQGGAPAGTGGGASAGSVVSSGVGGASADAEGDAGSLEGGGCGCRITRPSGDCALLPIPLMLLAARRHRRRAISRARTARD